MNAKTKDRLAIRKAARQARRSITTRTPGDVIVNPPASESVVEVVPATTGKTNSYDDPIADVSEIRDLCMGLVDRSHLTYAGIKERGGACASTLTKWAHKETRRPQLATLVRTLRVLDHDIAIIQKKWNPT